MINDYEWIQLPRNRGKVCSRKILLSTKKWLFKWQRFEQINADGLSFSVVFSCVYFTITVRTYMNMYIVRYRAAVSWARNAATMRQAISCFRTAVINPCSLIGRQVRCLWSADPWQVQRRVRPGLVTALFIVRRYLFERRSFDFVTARRVRTPLV